VALIASATAWSYMQRVLLPWEEHVNVKPGKLKAEMGDLYPRWVGTRELLLSGRNPYGKEVSSEIQMGFYGHAIDQTYDKPASEIVDEQRFVYPLYVVLLLAPTVHLDFAHLQMWAPVIFEALTVISVWLWIGVVRWRPPPLVTASLVLLVASSPQVAQGLRLRQIGLFVAFLVALAAWLVTREHYFAGGALLAIATIKPQMVVLCIAWFLLWSFGSWKRRWPLAAGFGSALAILVGAGEMLLPGWPRFFLEGLEAYRMYFPTISPLRLILGNWIGWALSILIVIVLFVFSWLNRKASANSPEFVEGLAAVFITTALVLPLVTPYNQVLLLMPVILVLRDWAKVPRIAKIAFAGLAASTWIIELAMLAHPAPMDAMNRYPLLPSLVAFPFVVAVLILIRRTSDIMNSEPSSRPAASV
jgi:hypothetical protein